MGSWYEACVTFSCSRETSFGEVHYLFHRCYPGLNLDLARSGYRHQTVRSMKMRTERGNRVPSPGRNTSAMKLIHLSYVEYLFDIQ